MAYDRFLIAPLKSGLITSLPAWQIPEDAFSQLNDAYVFRGVVKKRVGAELMGTGADSSQTAPLRSRLRINLGNTVAGALSGTVPGVEFNVGQQFSIFDGSTDVIFTVQATGNPVDMLATGAATIKTYDTTTGAFVFTGVAGGAAQPVFFYPAEPVMGITNFEINAINNQPTLAFDTQFAYQFSSTGWNIAGPVPPAADSLLLRSTNLDYVWATNWEGISDDLVRLFITNFHVTNLNGAGAATDDPINMWDGTGWFPLTGTGTGTPPGALFFNPSPGGVPGPRVNSDFVLTARIILPFKDRLILLNVVENSNPNNDGLPGAGTNTHFSNRCRFSFNGSPLSRNAWYEIGTSDTDATTASNGAGGGFVDAPTKEEIISAQFIKDRLIVYFERSTWELAYTGNEVLPFVWQQINQELGALGTFSTVPFDKAVLGIGDSGVHSCSGANVERIDNEIPDTVFTISKQSNGSRRIAGIRDFFTEVVYWAYPSVSTNSVHTNRFPDKLLVYNYANNTWAIWNDTFTAFGYYYQLTDEVWQGDFQQWQEDDTNWTAGIQYQNERRIVAGNQQGYVVLFDRDLNFNAQAYSITDVGLGAGGVITLTIINHNLEAGDYILIADLQGITGFTSSVFMINTITINTATVAIADLGGVYDGGGSATRVSQVDILTKQWNPYVSQGSSLYLAYIDFAVERTANGEITVDYLPSTTNLSMIDEAEATGMNLGTNILETRPYALFPLENQQRILWHRVYFQTDGTFIQLRIFWNDEQMRDASISLSDFQLEGLVLNTMLASRDWER